MSTMRRNEISLGLGADLVREFLPHRPPFLFVDTVEAFSSGEQPSLSASHHISPNEPVFAGHFPDLYLWPSVYTIEGLAQSCLLLRMILALEAGWVAVSAPSDLATTLRAWQQNLSRPGSQPDRRVEGLNACFANGSFAGRERRSGLLVEADVKLVHPVFAGQRLEYHVQRTHVVGQMYRFDVHAAVGGRPTARGVLTLAMAGGEQ